MSFALLHTTIILPKETLLNTKTYHTLSGPESKRRFHFTISRARHLVQGCC